MDLPVPDASNYFITADAGYCHILPDRIILTTKTVYTTLPPSEDKKSTFTLILGGAGIAFGSFLMINFFIVGMYLMGLLLLFAMVFACKALADVAKYSAILNIPRNRVEDVRVYKPLFGYLYIIVRFKNGKGGTGMRKIKFYDSKQNELHALEILKREGLID